MYTSRNVMYMTGLTLSLDFTLAVERDIQVYLRPLYDLLQELAFQLFDLSTYCR